MSFSDLGLDAGILSAVTAAGYTDPTPVQREAIPAALSGADLLVSSHTGSGKTAAFMRPALQRPLPPSATRGRGPPVRVPPSTRQSASHANKAAARCGRGHAPARNAARGGRARAATVWHPAAAKPNGMALPGGFRVAKRSQPGLGERGVKHDIHQPALPLGHSGGDAGHGLPLFAVC